jgi:hypothetical protein
MEQPIGDFWRAGVKRIVFFELEVVETQSHFFHWSDTLLDPSYYHSETHYGNIPGSLTMMLCLYKNATYRPIINMHQRYLVKHFYFFTNFKQW